jgi:hypothetical protein
VPGVTPIHTVTGVQADSVACGPGGAWAAASRRVVTLGDGRSFQARRPLTGALRFGADASLLLAGTELLELDGGSWAELGDPLPAVAEGAGELELTAAAWDSAAERLVLAATRRPSRSARAAAEPPGPNAWLTLIDGRARTALRGLWEGRGLPPRHVAIEGLVIAADPDRRAQLWTEREERAPATGPVDGLALGDGGRLLLVTHRDGRVMRWPGPAFDAPSQLGDGAARLVAAAADAAVFAWATGAGVTVHADGRLVHVGTKPPAALALAADGSRLAVLDAERTLRLFAIDR